MSCQVEQIADCGDVATIARALFIPDKEDTTWLSQCSVSLSPCGNLLAVGYASRLCLLTSQWISSTDSNTYLISWSGSVPGDITAVTVLPICPSQHSSQNGPDWFCIFVGFQNGLIGLYTNTGHLLFSERLYEKPVLKISCHTGTYGTLTDDISVLYPNCVCVILGNTLFQTLRYAKAQLAKVQAGVKSEYTVDSRNIQIKKWLFSDQEITDASVVGLEVKTTYDHLLAASTYGGYDVWYRSIPPAITLVLGVGVNPYVGFHYAVEGGTNPPLQDVARAVANKIKSALPGWFGGGSTETQQTKVDPKINIEPLSLRSSLYDPQRQGSVVAVSQDRRLAAFADSFGRVAVLDVDRGYLVRLFKGYRDAQCAFMQIYDLESKKPQLATIKEYHRATFLIIYNPKKGLIDIRLMQRGNRVAVFTATKNGKLLYNTCGLVGAEPKYYHKRLNLPTFQCVLIDPDGKLKTFTIPFFFALEGDRSARSKDLHILRELRSFLKKSTDSTNNEDEILSKISELQMLDLKKQSVEMLIRHKVSSKILMSCLEIIWDNLSDVELDAKALRIKKYFYNLVLITLFFRRINNENIEDMETLTIKVREDLNTIKNSPKDRKSDEEEVIVTTDDESFSLLENDSCILERILIMVQEKDYKEHQHARVTFAEDLSSTYKDFLTCFNLEDNTEFVNLKADVSTEKLNNIASYLFKAIFKVKDYSKLSIYVKESSINPIEMVKLIITHIMNMSLEDINIELIEKIIAVIYYLSKCSDDAAVIAYNELSSWWQQIRDLLIDMPCPLKALIVAMACKAVVRKFEENSTMSEEEPWEYVTSENAKWGILIGQLEDISTLSIIILLKEPFVGSSLPKLLGVDCDINLRYIYSRGKGSVTELVSKWLCSLGVHPEAIVINDMMNKIGDHSDSDSEADEKPFYESSIYVESRRNYIDDNSKIFKWVSLLQRQFPCSTTPDYIIGNMSWEYAISWQKKIEETDNLSAVVECLRFIADKHLRLGLCIMVWNTYVREVFTKCCRLVNKVGKLPTEMLCTQDTGLSDIQLVKFFMVATRYLELFYEWSSDTSQRVKNKIVYENIWNDDTLSLLEVAQFAAVIDTDIVNLNYQISLTIYSQVHFNLKFTKPLDNLYDIDYHYILEAITGKCEKRVLNLKPSDKLRVPRMKFLTKVVRAALSLITFDECGPQRTCNSVEYEHWVDSASALALLWHVDDEFVTRQQCISLYHNGYDNKASVCIQSLRNVEDALPPLLAITTQRLKRNLQQSSNPGEWIVSMPPHLYRHIKSLEPDESVPANPSIPDTASILRLLINKTDNEPETSNVRLAELLLQGCELILEHKL